MRSFLKVTGIIPLLILFLLSASALAILPVSRRLRRKLQTGYSSLYCRMILRIINVRVLVHHRERLQGHDHGLLIVANHVSYLDIFIIASLRPTVFITSVELGSTLFLGTLARLGGSLFVERRKATGLKREISMIADILGQGFTIALFPEGTTSNGETVHAFKNSLFESAITAGKDILPVCIRYARANNLPITHEHRDSVFYYGGATIFQHLPRLLALRSVDVDVFPLKTVRTKEKTTRKELAAETHDAIREAYHSGTRELRSAPPV